MTLLPTPEPGRDEAEAFVADHLGHLVADPVAGSPAFPGGQQAADRALTRFDVTGYAARRNQVSPVGTRGASRLSPYLRHGLLHLSEAWDHVADGPARDVARFRDELLWQEYARHWYAAHGTATRRGVRRELPPASDADPVEATWDRSMRCVAEALDELETDGWLVNQARMWLASHWSVRRGRAWREGEDRFFAHLLDGSRAANRLGWQWTTGVGSSKTHGFSRWQVERRAPGYCASCALVHECPIEEWPPDPSYVGMPPGPARASVPGPLEPESHGRPRLVWLTAESLGARDPAAAAHPDLPVVFVFDEPLLAGLRLSSKRLVFLAETLAELGAGRTVELHLGDPVGVLAGRRPAVTWAPVPGFATRASAIGPAEVRPWPWLIPPPVRTVSSFTAWRRSAPSPA